LIFILFIFYYSNFECLIFFINSSAALEKKKNIFVPIILLAKEQSARALKRFEKNFLRKK